MSIEHGVDPPYPSSVTAIEEHPVDLSRTSGAQDSANLRLGSDPSVLSTIRTAAAVLFLFEAVLFGLAIAAGRSLGVLIPLNIAALIVTALFFRFTWSPSYSARWRTAIFTLGVIVVVLAAASGFIVGRTAECFAAAVLLIIGTAAIVPWGRRWQVFFTLVLIGIALGLSRLTDTAHAGSVLQWLELIIAAVLGVFVAPMAEQYRAAGRAAARGALLPGSPGTESRAANQSAVSASTAESEFISAVSHELRTPMNVILGMADLLAETTLDGEQRKYLSIMMNNGAALHELIDDILDFARIEGGHLVLEQANFDLCDLVERVAETLAIRAHQKQLELAVRLAPDVPIALVGDPMRLRQVLINLLGNAIKFTEKGEVIVRIEREAIQGAQVRLHFTVSDTGIGIAEEQRQRIFARYAQADSSTARKYGGSGLGLAIVKQLVELMGGQIWVESEIGRGSTFHFTACFTAQAETELEACKHSLKSIRVLVADPNTAARGIVAEILNASGALAEEADSIQQALAALRQASAEGSPYQVILLACVSPAEDIREMLHAICAAAGPARIVSMLSSDHLNIRLPLIREMGLAHYLIKPIRRAELIAMIADLAVPHQPAEPLFDDAQDVAKEGGRQPMEEEPAEGADQRLRVLVADDSADNRLLIEAFLKRASCVLDHAEDGREALEKFTGGKYDVVILDIQMPIVDGYTVARKIRQWEREGNLPPTPIIALTASVLDEEVSRAIEAGCDTHVSKPVRRTTLLAAISEVTGRFISGKETGTSRPPFDAGLARITGPNRLLNRQAPAPPKTEAAVCSSPPRRA